AGSLPAHAGRSGRPPRGRPAGGSNPGPAKGGGRRLGRGGRRARGRLRIAGAGRRPAAQGGPHRSLGGRRHRAPVRRPRRGGRHAGGHAHQLPGAGGPRGRAAPGRLARRGPRGPAPAPHPPPGGDLSAPYTERLVTERKYHVGLAQGDVGQYVLYPGDPARTAVIARFLDGAREGAFSREYRTFTGTVAGVAVSAVSSGMGGPSVAIGVEEMRE